MNFHLPHFCTNFYNGNLITSLCALGVAQILNSNGLNGKYLTFSLFLYLWCHGISYSWPQGTGMNNK